MADLWQREVSSAELPARARGPAEDRGWSPEELRILARRRYAGSMSFSPQTSPGPLIPTQAEQRLLDRIADAEPHMLELLQAWGNISSGSANREGLDRMRAELAEAFGELGGKLTEVPLPAAERTGPSGEHSRLEVAPALRIRKREDAPVRIALTGHYDTVFDAASPFQSVSMLEPDRLSGPGVADMKGGLVVLLESLRALERSPHASNLGWTVLLSPDEEIGSPGSRGALGELGAWADAGMSFEPCLSDGALVGARKGSAVLALIVHGRAAHAGREPHLGRNAVAVAARFAAELDALNGFRPGVTINVARIEGGGAVNVVPELAICQVGIRVPDAPDWAALQGELERLLVAARARDGIEVELRGGLCRPPKPLAAANRRLLELALAAGATLGLSLEVRESGGVSEGNNLWAAGCPNVDSLGVRGGGIHSTAEFAIVSSLVERTRLSSLMLFEMASGSFDARRPRGEAR